MPKLPNAFNPNEKEDMGTFAPLPVGEYAVEVNKTEYKQNSAETGHFLRIVFTVVEGEHKGRLLFSNLNLDNPNSDTVDRAERELATIAKACGVNTVIEDSDILHGKELIVDVIIKKATPNFPASNSIRNYQANGNISKPSNPSTGGGASKAKDKPKVSFD